MKKFSPKTTVQTIITKKWELTTEDIEAIIADKLGLENTNANFDWDASHGFVRGILITYKTES